MQENKKKRKKLPKHFIDPKKMARFKLIMSILSIVAFIVAFILGFLYG